MEKNELILLETVLGCTRNGNGFQEKEETAQTEVFCAVKSAGRKEFYDAERSGYKASTIFVVDHDDFETAARDVAGKKVRASRVVYNNVRYLIHRTYVKEYGDMELTCEEVE